MTTSLLIVDDESDIRDMLSRHFRYMGYSVDTAENGAVASKILAEKKVDILISDIMMPEMNGVELLRLVKSEYPMIRPIMITGYVTLENALACMRYGADACVFKPINDLKQLEEAVENAAKRLKYWMDILKELRGMK